ncbi:MAG: PKD domain-containing protein [Phycisphaerales bacterium]|nr:MAG: PKD domain-containing protein [Phycisphaerales bacterium]
MPNATRLRGTRGTIGYVVLAITAAPAGCGSISTQLHRGDRDTLPSTIIEDDGVTGGDDSPDALIEGASSEDYSIVATQVNEETGVWEFSVAPKADRTTSDLTFEWDFGTGETSTGPEQAYAFWEPGVYVVTVTGLGRKDTVEFVLSLEIEIGPANEPPVADAGVDQTADENDLVFLYGGLSLDPDQDELTYSWAQVSGDPVMLLNKTEATASFVTPLVDEDTQLSFVLTVSDGGLTGQDSVTVYVVDYKDSASTGPVADAGTDQEVLSSEVVTLDGTGSSSADGGSLSYEWYQWSGPTVELSDPSSAIATFQAPVVDLDAVELVFELVVTEGELSAGDEVTITVSPDDSSDTQSVPPPGGDTPPGGDVPTDNCPTDPDKTEPGICGCGVADIDTDSDGTPDCSDSCPDDGNKVTPGTCGCGVADDDSDSDGTADCNDGCPNDVNKAAPGACGCGQADTDSDDNGVADCNEPPALSVSTGSLDFGTTSDSLVFELWNSGGLILDYDVVDNAAWLDVSPTSGTSTGERDTMTAMVTRGTLSEGQYDAEITVTPSVGSAFSIAVAMTVAQAAANPPSPVIVATRTTGVAPVGVFFDGTSSTPATGVLKEHRWDFGDGTTFSGFNAAHVYEVPGTYDVTLTVRDEGETASATTRITVQPFSGTTYYVRADGNDNNAGTGDSPALAWKSLTKALTAVTRNNIVQPGGRVLFRRGDTFTYTTTVTLRNAHDVIIGAYPATGDPATRPLFQYAGTSTGHDSPAIFVLGDCNGLTFMDIQVNSQSLANGAYANGFGIMSSLSPETRDVLLFRTKFDHFFTNVIEAATGSGIILAQSTLTNSHEHKGHLLLARSSRLGILDNYVGKAHGTWNIGMYLSGLQKAVIAGNRISELASYQDSPTIRFTGNARPAFDIVCADNVLDGAGTWQNVEFLASDPDNHWVENIVFERNVVSNAGTTLLAIREGYRNIVIRNNVFKQTERHWLRLDTESTWGSLGAIQDVAIYNNTIVTEGAGSAVWVTTPNVENVQIVNNAIQATASSSATRLLQADSENAAALSNIAFDFNLYHVPNRSASSTLFTSGANNYTVAQWLAGNPYGGDTHSVSADPAFADAEFHLSSSSAAIDAGTDLGFGSVPGVDDPGRTPWPGLEKANVRDIGAWEWNQGG